MLVGPPCCIKLLAAAKITPQVSNTASGLVLFLGLGVTTVVQRSVIGYEKVDDLFLADGIFVDFLRLYFRFFDYSRILPAI